jgi:signal transduction histidine kinase
MSERVKALGGTLAVASGAGRGVTLTARLPVVGRDAAALTPVTA